MLRFLTIFIFTIMSILSTPLELHKVVQAETDENKSVSEALKDNQKNKVTEKNEPNETSPLLEEETEVATVENQFGALDFFNVIFALFLVVMLLYVTLRFIKKKNQTYGHTKMMMNLGGTSLGGNRSVQLVKIGDRILIVGVGEDVQLLKEIDSEAEIERILLLQQNELQQILQPSNLMSRLLGQIKGFGKEDRSSQDSFKSILSKQLSELSDGRKKILQELDRKGNKGNE